MHAAFFDVDGTLCDTRADLAATVNHTRADFGLRPLSQEAVLSYVGSGAKYLLSHAISELADKVDELWKVFSSHYAEHATEAVTLYPGVRETLDSLVEKGWKLGVVTNKPRFAVDAIFEKLDIAKYFGSAIVAGGDIAELKPSAAPLFACAEKLGHEVTREDWMIGDSWNDLDCAKNANVKAAFCAFGFGNPKACKMTAKLSTMTDLLKVI